MWDKGDWFVYNWVWVKVLGEMFDDLVLYMVILLYFLDIIVLDLVIIIYGLFWGFDCIFVVFVNYLVWFYW